MMDFALTPWSPMHAQSAARNGNNEKIAFNLRDGFPIPYTLQDARDYIQSCMQADEADQYLRAIVVDGEAAGSVGVFVRDNVYRCSAELGYWLGEPFWGRGIMTRAVRQICAEAFARYNIVRIYAEPFAFNPGSRRVLEKAGFALEGILRSSVIKGGTVYDSCVYSLLRHECTDQAGRA